MPRANTKLAEHADTILIFIHTLPDCARNPPMEFPASLMPTIISDFAALIIRRSIKRQGFMLPYIAVLPSVLSTLCLQYPTSGMKRLAAHLAFSRYLAMDSIAEMTVLNKSFTGSPGP